MIVKVTNLYAVCGKEKETSTFSCRVGLLAMFGKTCWPTVYSIHFPHCHQVQFIFNQYDT